MRDFAKISPQFWISERGRAIRYLGIKAQLIAFYLLTNPHASMIGIYYLPIAFIAHETGIQYDEVGKILEDLSKINFCIYDHKSEYIWVQDMASEQLGLELKFTDNRVKGIHDAFSALPNLPFINLFLEKYATPYYLNTNNVPTTTHLEAPSKPLQSKEKEKNNEKEINNYNETDLQYYEFVKNELNQKTNESEESISEESLTLNQQAIKILAFFNFKNRTNYLPESNNLNLIFPYLQSGVSIQQCIYVITKKHRDWIDNETMKNFLTLEVIFGKKFKKYLAELRTPKLKDNA